MKVAFASACMLVLLALAAPTPAQGALNGDHSFSVQAGFLPGFGGGNLTLLSGKADATLSSEAGPYAFLTLTGTTSITGLSSVYTQSKGPVPYTGNLAISLPAHGGFLVRFPTATGGAYSADHLLAIPVDLKDLQSEGVNLGPSLAGIAQAGTFRFSAVDVPVTQLASADVATNLNQAAVLVPLGGTATILSGGVAVETIQAEDGILFQGKPVFTHSGTAGIASQVAILPFQHSSLRMEPASKEAARAGLNLTGLTQAVQDIQVAFGKTQQGDGKTDTPDLGAAQPLLAGLLNGAYLHAGGSGNGTQVLQGLQLIRFTSLKATSSSRGLAMSGSEPFRIQGGRVVDAPGLVGFSYLQLPWWSWLFWVLGIAAFVTRLVLKSPKHVEHWDRYRWVGRAAGALLFLVVLWLWDLEVQHVLGVSLLGGDGSGAAFLPLVAIEFAPLMIVYFAVVTPLRLLIVNSLRIGRQGTFMNLGGPAAILLGYLLGASLLLSYIDLALAKAGGA